MSNRDKPRPILDYPRFVLKIPPEVHIGSDKVEIADN